MARDSVSVALLILEEAFEIGVEIGLLLRKLAGRPVKRRRRKR